MVITEANQKREFLPDVQRHRERMMMKLEALSDIIFRFENEWMVRDNKSVGPETPPGYDRLLDGRPPMDTRATSTIDDIYNGMVGMEKSIEDLFQRLGIVRQQYLGEKS